MAYNVTKTDGTQLIILVDGAFNDSVTDLKLLGKGVVNYGEIMAENLVWMLENFSNETPPPNPLLGQLWYNRTTGLLNIYKGTSGWKLPFVSVDEAVGGVINMDSNRIINLGNPTSPTDALNLSYAESVFLTIADANNGFINLTTGDSRYLKLAGGTISGPLILSGNLNMAGSRIEGLGAPNSLDDAVSLGYLQANYSTGSSSSTVNAYTMTQYFAAVSVTTSGSIPWDLDTEQVKIITLTNTAVMAAPTNLKAGATYTLIIKQDNVGGHTLDLNDPTYKFPGAVAVTLSTVANSIDVIAFVCDGTSLLGVFQGDFS